MANRNRKQSPPAQQVQWSVPFLLLLAFGLGAGTTWLVMRGSTSSPSQPQIESFLPAVAANQGAGTPFASAPAAVPPDVSQLAPAEAARTLANWNYDRQNWTHAIEHYEEAIARGADNPDVRTDLGNCYRFLGQPEKALEQYQLAQKQNLLHENSLFNQISLLDDMLHDKAQATAAARDFIERFPQSPQTAAVRQRLEREAAQPSPPVHP